MTTISTPVRPATVSLGEVRAKATCHQALDDDYHLYVTPGGVYMFRYGRPLWVRDDIHEPQRTTLIVRNGNRVSLFAGEREILDVLLENGQSSKPRW